LVAEPEVGVFIVYFQRKNAHNKSTIKYWADLIIDEKRSVEVGRGTVLICSLLLWIDVFFLEGWQHHLL
jgi:hypothetical protein